MSGHDCTARVNGKPEQIALSLKPKTLIVFISFDIRITSNIKVYTCGINTLFIDIETGLTGLWAIRGR